MEISDFNGELTRSFLAVLNRTMQEAQNHPDFNFSKNNHQLLTVEGKYAQAVFNYYSKILDLKDDLKKTEIFLRRFPSKKYYEANNIFHLDYIRYHTEVFYHKTATLLDIMKLMVNEVFEIGLQEQECNWNKLRTSKGANKNPALKIIENYHKSFEHIINARHLNTHRGIFKDAKKEVIEAPLLIYRNIKKFNMEVDEQLNSVIPQFIVEYQLKKYRDEKVVYIKNGNEVAEKYINMFMNVTLSEFLGRAKSKCNGS